MRGECEKSRDVREDVCEKTRTHRKEERKKYSLRLVKE